MRQFMKTDGRQPTTNELNEVSALMDTIIEYRTIIAELMNFNQADTTTIIYRAEHALSPRMINQITDRSTFLAKARKHAPH